MADKEYAYLTGIGLTGTLADKRNAYYTDLINNGGEPDRPSTGQYVPERIIWTSSSTSTSGSIFLSFFTAYKTQTVTAVTAYTGSTAAAATPTVCQYGLYSVDSTTGNLTLMSATTNDTALFASTTTAYRKALDTAQTINGGSRYAVGVLVVTGATAPSLISTGSGSAVITGTVFAVAPRITGVRSGQTSMVSSIAEANLVTTGQFKCFLLD